MIFSYNWLQSFFDKKLPKPEELAEILTLHSFETRIEKKEDINDSILDIEILPNRSHDCFSHLGIAKEISALLGINLKSQEKKKFETLKQKIDAYLSLEVKEPDLCKRYIASIVLGVKVKQSPDWLKERLVSVGQKPINNIVDCTNYVMLEMGQPLHAFDMDKLNPVKIIVRRAKKGEKITTLDNKNFELDEDILVIADNSVPLAIAGIKGGKKAEIDGKTKNIILESANFDSLNIRLTSRKLNLHTEASFGFENEISPALAQIAMNRVIDLIQEIAGGESITEKIDFYPKKIRAQKISFEFSDISKLLGINIPEKKVFSILESLGFEPKKEKKEISVVCPIERLDLVRKEDVIEEIARIYGYEKIPAEIPKGLLIPTRRNEKYFYGNLIKDILTGIGFSEVYNYSFAQKGEIEIQNPISSERKYLRTNIINGLFDNADFNLKYFNEVKIFEIGKTFCSVNGEVVEKNILAVINISKNKKSAKEEFLGTRGILENIFHGLGISGLWLDDVFENKEKNSSKIAEIKVENKEIGTIYKGGFEIDMDKLVDLATKETEYRPISKYPAVMRDIAIVVPSSVKVADVSNIVENIAGSILIDTDLFDIYEGENLGENRKSFAFHLIFQSPEKTLSDKEINNLMDKIIKAVEENKSWEVRK